MSAIWAKVRPHLLSWHMVPCLVMLVAAVGVAIATGQPQRVLSAIGCMVMMMVMVAAMSHGGHDHAGRGTSGGDRDDRAAPGDRGGRS